MTEDEFLRLYQDEARAIFRFCAFRCGSAHEAEDLTAETFTRLLSKGQRIRAEKRIAWLYAVARNLCADLGRRKPWGGLEGVDPPSAEDAEPVWLDDRVRSAIAGLTPKNQQVLFLRAVEDLPYERIAVRLGMSETATRMRYHRAVSAVRSRLEA